MSYSSVVASSTNRQKRKEMQEETRRVLLSLRERLVGEHKMYEGRMDKYKARGNSLISTVDLNYWSGNAAGVSVAISHIDEEMRRLEVSGDKEKDQRQQQQEKEA